MRTSATKNLTFLCVLYCNYCWHQKQIALLLINFLWWDLFSLFLLNKLFSQLEKLKYVFSCCRYKCASNGVPTTMTNGSTLPLVSSTGLADPEAGGYNPFEHRRLEHPTSWVLLPFTVEWKCLWIRRIQNISPQDPE